ncbi:immunoglobulin lambda-1 light chain [Lates calcarifer]|uniref:immunoglobulin lambda-1 light chain n=1 Tax=Lates calcarifer TaxID=8187 RepID=UPI0021D7A107|nr:immunoglobulin lambda-1 light chain [Lates calcarifer]
MLFLPAAALCCLCSALVAMAADLVQDQLSLTRRVGQSVSFSCGGTEGCYNSYIVWYQKNDTETFKAILLFDASSGNVHKPYNHPQQDDFTAENKENGCELKIETVQVSHSASYYCLCLKSADRFLYQSLSLCYFIFGSGTKLYVTDEDVVKPVVSVYPAASRAHLEGKTSLLCLASGMFPPLVQFSWKRPKEDGSLEELPSAEGEQLELRESGRTTSILLVHQPENSTYKYHCYVKHETGTVEAQIQRVVPLDPLQPQCRVKLLCLLYTVLIVKSLVYGCGLSLLTMLRN